MNKSVTKSDQVVEGSTGSYVVGFILSLLLTLVAYMIVVQELFSLTWTLVMIALLAIVQLIVQLVLFLHIGKERRPRWKLVVFVFMVGVIVIVVGGSLWIMQNLNYHMGHEDINIYLHNQDSL
jgi:cytochrome o ubiquinol oxidase subunit IV